MKLRLTNGGFDKYTGQMGVIQFVDGLSVDDVLPIDAIRVAGIIGGEWEDGTPANVSQMYLDNMNTPATSSGVASIVEAEKSENGSVTPYTEEYLHEIATNSGISGIREIADKLGIKGNSIRGLIDAILKV